MAKDPAVLFYTADFLAGTQFFTDEQCGQYIRLLCQQHQLGHIPENHMKIICKSYDSPVLSKFTKDVNGEYYNIRMDEEKEKRIKYCQSRSNNKKRRTKEKSYDSSYDSSYENHMSIHMDNENENENKDINESEIKKRIVKEKQISYSEDFLKFWSAYPKKIGKDKAWESWSKRRPPLESVLKALEWQIKSDQWCREGGQFIPNPSTYLNQGRWTDEPVNKNGLEKPKMAEMFDDPYEDEENG